MSMTVADLQGYFADLGRFVGKSGSKALEADLAAVQASLAPFAGMTLAKFAEFLAGKEPPQVRRGRSAGRASGKPAPDPAEVAANVRRLYDTVNEPASSWQVVEEGLAVLQNLTKDGVLQVAERMEIRGMARKSKQQIVEAIRQRIESRKGANQRAEMTQPLAAQ